MGLVYQRLFPINTTQHFGPWARMHDPILHGQPTRPILKAHILLFFTFKNGFSKILFSENFSSSFFSFFILNKSNFNKSFATFGMQSYHHISFFLILHILISKLIPKFSIFKFNFQNFYFQIIVKNSNFQLIFKTPISLKFNFQNSNSQMIFKIPICFKFNFQNSNF